MAVQGRVFTALSSEDYERTEFTSAWFITFMDELETRKYGTRFNPKLNKVNEWVYKHKDIALNTPLEEQERMMIEDGVLTPEDI